MWVNESTTASAHAIELGMLLPSSEVITLNERELFVLRQLRKLHPRLMTNTGVEVAADLSKVTVGKAIIELIEKICTFRDFMPFTRPG